MLRAVLISAITTLPVWVLLAAGFYVALRVLKFPDLTVDVTFVAGAVGAAWGATAYESSIVGMLVAMSLGALGGVMTGLLYSLNRTPMFKLLASALILFSFYSINYRVLGGKATLAFYNASTIFNGLGDWEALRGLNPIRPFSTLLGYSVAAGGVLLLYGLLRTRIGLLLRTVGPRPGIVEEVGYNGVTLLIIGLAITNSVVALGGWLNATFSSQANINVFGSVIHALAAVVFGEVLFDHLPIGRSRSVSPRAVMAVPVLGAVVYQVLLALVTYLISNTTRSRGGAETTMLQSQDLNLIFALTVAGVLALSRLLRYRHGQPPVLEADAL